VASHIGVSAWSEKENLSETENSLGREEAFAASEVRKSEV
jgi:hypothetical protein